MKRRQGQVRTLSWCWGQGQAELWKLQGQARAGRSRETIAPRNCIGREESLWAVKDKGVADPMQGIPRASLHSSLGL